ncbi:MAG: PQQ-like beta-propeller repeat protein, partial [Pirellulaceae bacterium]|nr:PQQ-like beta-propeller repeat protein [Pirellulaceae bacterium]
MLLAAVLLLAVAVGVSIVPAGETEKPETEEKSTSNWPLFRGNSLSQGVASGSLVEKPELLWKFQVKDGAFEGTPAVVDGIVYIADLDGTLFALRLANGKKSWEYKIEGGFIASPAVHQKRVYVGDYDGNFYCVDATNGKALWAFKTQAEIDASANFYKDKVLIGSSDATLYCLNTADGTLAWKHEIADQIRCSPTIVGNRCFLAGCDGRLHIIDI